MVKKCKKMQKKCEKVQESEKKCEKVRFFALFCTSFSATKTRRIFNQKFQYRHPKFETNSNGRNAKLKRQKTGVRQGISNIEQGITNNEVEIASLRSQ